MTACRTTPSTGGCSLVFAALCRHSMRSANPGQWEGSHQGYETGFGPTPPAPSRAPCCRDTSAVVLRVLTARAVQRVLEQLQETCHYDALFLNNFCSEVSPSAEGNKVNAARMWCAAVDLCAVACWPCCCAVDQCCRLWDAAAPVGQNCLES